ncbi:hypothetical protein C370_00834, partial [Cryptococcus neoformans A1-35-8]
WAFNCTQPNKSSSSLSAAKSFFSYISNLHKYFPSSTFVFNLPHKHLYLYHNAPVCNFITKRLQSHLQASSGNPYRRTNNIIEAASIGPEETLVRRLHKAVLKGSLWILMTGKAMMTFLRSWWMSLFLKRALRVMEM